MILLIGIIGGLLDFLRGRDWPSELLAWCEVEKWEGEDFEREKAAYKRLDALTSKVVTTIVMGIVGLWPLILPVGLETIAAIGVTMTLYSAYAWGWGTLKAFSGSDTPDRDFALDGLVKKLWNSVARNKVSFSRVTINGLNIAHRVNFKNDIPTMPDDPRMVEARRKYGAVYMTVRSGLFYVPFLAMAGVNPWSLVIGLHVLLYGLIAYACGKTLGRYGEHGFSFIRGALILSAMRYLIS